MPTVLIAVALAVILLATALVLGRRRRETALEPVRLGPSWTPGQDEMSGDLRDPDAVARRADAVAERTGTDRAVVVRVLDVWDEYLGVLGLAPLASDHRRLLYDPYDPPVARRGPDGRPQPDPDRVARDAAGRLGVAESVSQDVLRALDRDGTVVHRGPDVPEQPSRR
jgi:hypothetical protein